MRYEAAHTTPYPFELAKKLAQETVAKIFANRRREVISSEPKRKRRSPKESKKS